MPYNLYISINIFGYVLSILNFMILSISRFKCFSGNPAGISSHPSTWKVNTPSKKYSMYLVVGPFSLVLNNIVVSICQSNQCTHKWIARNKIKSLHIVNWKLSRMYDWYLVGTFVLSKCMVILSSNDCGWCLEGLNFFTQIMIYSGHWDFEAIS